MQTDTPDSIWSIAKALRREPLPTPINLTQPIGAAQEDAEILLAFAAQSQRGLKVDLVTKLTAALGSLRAAAEAQRNYTESEQAAFWLAYDEAAVALAPVSAHSIRSSMRINAKRFPASLVTPPAILAMVAMVVFFGCIVIQSFWVAGKELLNQADAIDSLRVELVKQNAKSESLRKAANARLIRFTEQNCNAGGNCASSTTASKSPPGDRTPTQAEAAELSRLTAKSELLKEEIDDRTVTIDSAAADIAELNERGRPITDLLVGWHSRIGEICKSSRFLDFLCLSSDRKDQVDLTQKKHEVAAAEKSLQDWLKKTSTKDASGTDASAKPTSPFLALLFDNARRQEYRALQNDVDARRREIANAEASIQRKTAHEVRIILNNLAAYVVPLVMGLLGALAFVLQSMTAQLRDHTFVPVSVGGSIVRLCLGAIAGVFGALATPASDTVLKGLPPLFVPFVFGYGIEILFSLLNRIVRTFTQGENPATRPT